MSFQWITQWKCERKLAVHFQNERIATLTHEVREHPQTIHGNPTSCAQTLQRSANGRSDLDDQRMVSTVIIVNRPAGRTGMAEVSDGTSLWWASGQIARSSFTKGLWDLSSEFPKPCPTLCTVTPSSDTQKVMASAYIFLLSSLVYFGPATTPTV